MTREELNSLGGEILDACIEVHRILGPGLLESVYKYALMHELKLRNIDSESKVIVPLIYKDHNVGKYFEPDLLVENEVIVELKSVEHMLPLYKAQLLSYLRLTKRSLGYLVNFNEVLLKDGFKRIVNNF